MTRAAPGPSRIGVAGPVRPQRDTTRWVGLIGAVSAAAVVVLARRRWARRLARVTQGVRPGVRTDDGVLLHTEPDGCLDAPVTVVFAHGFAARAQEYDAQREALGGRARLVLFDQRGHGQSGWGGHRSATIDRLGRDLGQVIDETTGSAPVVLVAHSMGGMAAIALADQRPELFGAKVVGVALLSTSAGHLARVALTPVAARVAVRSGIARGLLWGLWLVAPAVDALAPFRRRWGRRWLRRRLFGRGQPSCGAVSTMEDMWVHTPQSMAATFYPATVYYDKREAVRVFRAVPTLVLAGSDDATIPARRSEHIAREIGPKARLVLVPGAGHMVNLTHPDAVNAALLGLLDQVAPLPSPPRVAAEGRPGGAAAVTTEDGSR